MSPLARAQREQPSIATSLCGHTKKRTTPAKVGPDYSGVVNDGEDVQRTSPYTVTLFTTWLQQAKRLVHDLLVLAKLQEGLQEKAADDRKGHEKKQATGMTCAGRGAEMNFDAISTPLPPLLHQATPSS